MSGYRCAVCLTPFQTAIELMKHLQNGGCPNRMQTIEEAMRKERGR